MTDTQFTSDRQVLDALNRASELLAHARQRKHEPIAVIGMGCRFPGAPDLESYWELLDQGRCGIRSVAPDRWSADAMTSPVPKTSGKIVTDRAGFIEDVDQFDSRFFEITRREASSLDPQQRLLLEVAWRTLEHAGVRPSATEGGKHGVFVGICSNDYLALLNRNDHESIDAYHGTGNAHGTAAGRLSYFLKWEGPSMAIDTACSSSLVATHQAISSLRNDECESALVAGVNVILTPELSINLSQAGMLSPKGLCQAFAAGADGFVRGEGCGAVLLKRLSRAVEDGDRILCCLRGSAVNQDGRSNGLTAPNGVSQQAVIRAALKNSQLQPKDIDFIEAHGTGTELGDPIEIRALSTVFAEREQALKIGSVKTNVGHLEGAAGIAGLIKTCLALHRGELPRHLCFDSETGSLSEEFEPSEHIDWCAPIEIHAKKSLLQPAAGAPVRAGVSGFGFGGTNAHVVMEQYVANESKASETQELDLAIVKLSAKSDVALEQLTDAFINDVPPLSLTQISLSANHGRDDFECRRFVIADSREDFVSQLRGDDASPKSGPEYERLLAIGNRYVSGEHIDWEDVHPRGASALATLPGYPFIRQRCWFKSSDTVAAERPSAGGRESGHPLLGHHLDLATDVSIFQADVSGVDFLDDHRIGGEAVFPAAGYIEQALAAAKQLTGSVYRALDVSFSRAWRLSDESSEAQVLLKPNAGGYECQIQQKMDIGWKELASMTLSAEVSELSEIESWKTDAGDVVSMDEQYAALANVGIEYGPAFRRVVGLVVAEQRTHGIVELCEASGAGSYVIHPALLDGCFQTLAPLIPSDQAGTWLPVSIGELSVANGSRSPSKVYVVGELQKTERADQMIGQLSIHDDEGKPFARVCGLKIQRTDGGLKVEPAVSDERQAEIDAIRTKLAEATAAERQNIALHFAHQQVAEIGELEFDEVLLDSPLTSLGIDSIMAIELQGVLEKTLSANISMDLFLKDLSLREIIQTLVADGDGDVTELTTGSAEPVDDCVEGAL